MQEKPQCIAEDELQAYVDGLLPEERKAHVEQYLGAFPEEFERLEAYRRQNIGLHAFFDRPEQQTLSRNLEHLGRKLGRALFRQRMIDRSLRVAGALSSVAAIVTVSAWFLADRPPENNFQSLAFTRQATEAHLMLANKGYPGQSLADASIGTKLYNWYSHRFEDFSGDIPNLAQYKFEFVGGRVVPAPDGPALQLLYQGGDERQLTLFVGPAIETMMSDITLIQARGVSMAFWRRGALAYSLVGDLDSGILKELATVISGARTGPPARNGGSPSGTPPKKESAIQPAVVVTPP